MHGIMTLALLRVLSLLSSTSRPPPNHLPTASLGAAATRTPDDVTVQQLLDEIRPFGQTQVPDSVKAELLRRIRAAIAN